MKKTAMRRVSKRRAKQNREYSILRKAYIADHPQCEACNKRKSTEIHHKARRVGRTLCAVEYFMAVCRQCHNYIEANPAWARQHGYMVDRVTGNPNDPLGQNR